MDQNIITRSIPSLAITRQVIGFNDEVIDTAFLTSPAASTSTSPAPESHLAVATNSDLIRVYDLERFNTTLLEGHDDVVLCLAKSSDGELLVSGSKDKTARVWRGVPAAENGEDETAGPTWSCIGSAEGHVESIGAVAVAPRERNFLVTASQDRTAKIWDLAALVNDASDDADAPLAAIRSLTTQKIHDKDINSLDIAPNDKLLASGSQDRTAKLFSIAYTAKTKSTPATASLNLLGTFKGHKRGVWSVKFSPVDQCIATASGDRTVKLWSLQDFTCVKVGPVVIPSICSSLTPPACRPLRVTPTRSSASISSLAVCSSPLAPRMDLSRFGTSKTRTVRLLLITMKRRCVYLSAFLSF